jgi:putative protease
MAKVELLAPAGSWPSFIAAIESGADAVYLGGKQFSARQYADNFSLEEIEKAVEYAHVRSRKVYVTVNTLMDGDEMGVALDYIFDLQRLGIDAVIIQDAGLLAILRRVFPELRVHASTQMTVHNAAGMRLMRDHGIKRVVLARELGEKEIRAICDQVSGVEIEIFIHGALCYCYSGQCLFSSVVGGRSGNRGRCAQPCRLAYQLQTAGGKIHSAAGEYLLSPADLCLIDYLPAIQAAGVDSLKLEGRMKRPEYVATVTRIYRQALHRLMDGEYQVSVEEKEALAGIFNRNFTTGYWTGRSPDLLSISRPNNRGLYIGRVERQGSGYRTTVRLKRRLQLGDGIEVWVGRGKNPAMVVEEMEVAGHKTKQAEPGSEVVLNLPGKAAPGDRVFKTHDSRLSEKAAEAMQENRPEGKVPVKARVELIQGKPLTVRLADEQGNYATAITPSMAEKAINHPLTREDVYDKVDRLGNTPFYLREIDFHLEAGLMVPFSEINQARREAADALLLMRLEHKRPPGIDQREYQKRLQSEIKDELQQPEPTVDNRPLLSVWVSQGDDAVRAFQAGADRVYLGLEGPGRSRRPDQDSLHRAGEEAVRCGGQLVLALPRITRPLERIPWPEIKAAAPYGILAGNPGAVVEAREQGFRVFTDYSLNVFNPEAMRFWMEEGASGVCLSPELNFSQLSEWTASELSAAEVLVHGELVLMVSEYCMLRGALDGGESTCSGFCRRDKFALRDRKGFVFPVQTDANCRAYVLNSRTLCMIEDLPRLVDLGFGSLRIEARRGSPEYINGTVRRYRQALDLLFYGGEPDLGAMKEKLASIAPSEFTKIHYYRGVL